PAACWHKALDPLHRSVVQTFPSSVQAVPLVFLGSVGQAVLVPVVVAAMSHSPAAARHAVPAFAAACWHRALAPLHRSGVQGLPSLVHAVPLAVLASTGQAVLRPSHTSWRSHAPVEARHSVPAWPAGCWHAVLVPLHWSSVQALPSSVQAVPLVLSRSDGQ